MGAYQQQHQFDRGQNEAIGLERLVQQQQLELSTLHDQISVLQAQLAALPSLHEVEDLRREWQTSEELFEQSQKDNEHKHATIEHLKQYVKGLEAALHDTMGDSWKEQCNLTSPPSQSTAFAASTPLPKPPATGSRFSATLSKRSSRGHSRNVSAMDLRALHDIDIGRAVEKTTPTSALHKLTGIKEELGTSRLKSTKGLLMASHDNLRQVARSPIISTSGNLNHSAMNSSEINHQLLLVQMDNLLSALTKFPINESKPVETSHESQHEEAQQLLEVQKLSLLKLLEAAEKRAAARELHLHALVKRAKATRSTSTSD